MLAYLKEGELWKVSIHAAMTTANVKTTCDCYFRYNGKLMFNEGH
jgi:hypothetical protein